MEEIKTHGRKLKLCDIVSISTRCLRHVGVRNEKENDGGLEWEIGIQHRRVVTNMNIPDKRHPSYKL
jgi:hypothetical protein